MKILETARLVLREFQSADVNSMTELFADVEVMKFSRGTKSREMTQEWLKKCREDYLSFGFGLWAVVPKEDGQVAGYCGLTYCSDICGQREVEVGYRLRRSKWGLGIASEAALAVRDYGFEEIGLNRLIALVDPDNLASIKVAKNIGMKFEKEALLDGYDHPDYVYSIEKQQMEVADD